MVTKGSAHAKEAIACIYTIRKFHGDVPILCLADSVGKVILEQQDCNIVDFDDCGFKNFVIPHAKAQHFCPISIYGKMYIMKKAIEEYGNTMFVDADIILLNKIEVEDVELQLSQHFHRDQEKDRLYGKYNAGYLFAQNTKVPELWAELYLEGTGFYEQTPLEKLKSHFTFARFSEDHNVGFWRKRMPHNNKLTSLHFHHRKEAYESAEEHLVKIYDYFRDKFKDFIPSDIKTIMYGKSEG